MSFKERLFRPPWEHKDADIRLRAVTESDDPRLISELPRLAREDGDPGVRLAALRRVDEETLWLEARASGHTDAITEAADSALARAVTHKPDPEGISARLAWLDKLDDIRLIQQLASGARDPDLRRRALLRVKAQGFLGDRYVAEPDDEIASEILGRIHQASTLERIMQILKQTSKARYQAARKHLNRVHAQAGDARGAHQDAADICLRVEALARGEQVPGRAVQLQSLLDAWRDVDSPPEEFQRRFDGAVRIVQAALSAKSESADHDDVSPEPDGQDTDTQAHTGVTDTAHREFEPPPRKAIAESPPAPDPAELEAALDAAATALEAGETMSAQQLLNRARNLLDRVPQRQRPKSVTTRIQQMHGRLKEMHDWQHWSNNKLRERLIASAEELNDLDLHPDAISARLKEIRARWQELEQQEAATAGRKRHAAPPGQWRRFQAACKRAFERAKPYFETRQAIQNKALEELKEFLAQARELLHQESPAPDILTRHIRAARKAMRELHALPPRARGPMAGRLRTLIGQISKSLDAAFEKVEQDKTRLINQARQLAHEKDLDTAIREAKRLMGEWKKTGSVRRKRENELWRDFREPVDPLFEKLEERNQEKTAQMRATLAEIEDLCAQAEALAAAEEDTLESLSGRMAGLVKEWKGRRVRDSGLQDRFKTAAARFQERIAAHRGRAEKAAEDRLESLAAALQDVWQARLDSALEQDRERYRTLCSGHEDVSPLAVELAARLGRYADPQTDREALEAEVETNSEEARRIAVEMEFLAGLETPREDRHMRMDYQVRRLSSRLVDGAPQPDLRSELAILIERRLKSFPRPPAVHTELEKRFTDSKKSIQKMIGT